MNSEFIQQLNTKLTTLVAKYISMFHLYTLQINETLIHIKDHYLLFLNINYQYIIYKIFINFLNINI